ncbi:hypothetical protein ABT131_33795 [Streptomyces sp900105245]|uniref:hypothetical protein n=1 Tax=Streptomyces sp. 900105245 TaxID=3154379 RepID=UPI003327BF09
MAVPYGGCTEPSNVKAGGSSCPIRFQCAGCGFYRPDPSYLSAIEQHTNEPRADRKTAQAMDAAEFVITALTAQITAFEQVTDRMRRSLALLPAAERAEIEEASAVLRRARAGVCRRWLPGAADGSSVQPNACRACCGPRVPRTRAPHARWVHL